MKNNFFKNEIGAKRNECDASYENAFCLWDGFCVDALFDDLSDSQDPHIFVDGLVCI